MYCLGTDWISSFSKRLGVGRDSSLEIPDWDVELELENVPKDMMGGSGTFLSSCTLLAVLRCFSEIFAPRFPNSGAAAPAG